MLEVSELRIYRSIVVPTIVPILATLAIWTFLSTWNDFMWPLIVLSEEARWTLPVWLYVSVTGVIVYSMPYHLYPSR